MKFSKLVATSLLAIAATGLAAATAHGESAVLTPPSATAPGTVSGSSGGVGYATGVSDDGQGVTTRLTNGRFDVAPDGSAVTISAADGTMLERLPTVYAAAGRAVHLKTEVSADGSTLTMRPGDQLTVTEGQPAQEIGVIGAGAGIIVGVAAGGIVGCALGLIFFIIGCIPGIFVMAAVGAVIGGVLGFIVI
ncbi:hypothetical protein [Nocardia sp. NPDC052566]|uniref:hypothetical protein n=1 Tax=Nocardia sp. NPDC052566 TaxID=3364330 RepID=UPI0037C66D85